MLEAWSSLPERYNETSVFPGSEGGRKREREREREREKIEREEEGKAGGEGGQREKEETIWAEVGEFQSAGRQKEASWECVCEHLCVVIYVRE